MKLRLKKLHEQVVVITDASGAIGAATARLAAGRGARLVLASRDEQALRRIAGELAAQGCEVVEVVADASDEKQLRRIALAALQRFGEFDTWVNDAGTAVEGRGDAPPREEPRRVFETRFWNVVQASRLAVEHLRGHGGALINAGGAPIDAGGAPIDAGGPPGTMHVAAAHAVIGFTEALRTELRDGRTPVAVSLVRESDPGRAAAAILRAAAGSRFDGLLGLPAAALLGTGLLVGAVWRSRARGRAAG
jgi:short-subunit dehydrogenase